MTNKIFQCSFCLQKTKDNGEIHEIQDKHGIWNRCCPDCGQFWAKTVFNSKKLDIEVIENDTEAYIFTK